MKTTQRIALLLALVFVLPALFFSVYEISSLSRDEVMIQQVYARQLEAILFSVNQYSDDALSGWIAKIEGGLNEAPSKNNIPGKIKNLLALNSSIRSIYLRDSTENAVRYKIFSLIDSSKALQSKIALSLSERGGNIRQLISYKQSGFQKVEPIHLSGFGSDSLECLTFVVGDRESGLRLAGILVDQEIFIHEVIGPRLQVISKDQFVLSVVKKGAPAATYSTDPSDTAVSEALTKDFWLFPDYSLGIRTKGSSIKNLIAQRTTTNLVLLLSLDVILIIAVVLVFRNVKKEVHLAQNKSDFVSNVSHEIRTPLALISMFAETLEMGRAPTEEKKQEYYGIISKEAHRLSGIVNKILNFSQTEANKKKLAIISIDVSLEIRQILKTYDFHLKNKGFEWNFTPKTNIWVKFDREAFTEVVINLIDNAVKYSAEKKHIEITTGIENEYGCVAVKDHGVGISKMDQKHIFDKFYRVSSGDLAKSLGTGLGLSLVKQLMDLQHGQVKVSSEPGKGSTFKLYFPLDWSKS